MWANIVMSALEKFEVKNVLDEGTLKFYDRWVDDTFVRNRIADRDRISEAFHNFDNNIEFMAEIAKDVDRDGNKLKFIPVLGIGVLIG